MEVFQVSDRPASQDFYSVAGRLLFADSHDPELRNLIVDLFSGWLLSPVPFPDKSPDIRINFIRATEPRQIPPSLNHFEVAEGGRCYTDGADFYLALGDAVVHLRHDSPVTVDVSISELRGARDPLLARVASFAVCAALRRFGLFDLHSAGVIDPASGQAVLIVGTSGSGKSTLALQLAQSGWSYLSDDELLLGLVDGKVEVRGFRSFFAIRTGDGAPFKHCFEPDEVLSSKRESHAVAGKLIFTSVSGETRSEIRKLTQAETMTRLLRACPWATYDVAVAGANLSVLSTLARQAPAFDLKAGRDLLEPNHAANFLQKL